MPVVPSTPPILKSGHGKAADYQQARRLECGHLRSCRDGPRTLLSATQKGNKELFCFTDGERDRAQDWRDLPIEVREAFLKRAAGDGALGCWEAVGEVWLATREQRKHPVSTAGPALFMQPC